MCHSVLSLLCSFPLSTSYEWILKTSVFFWGGGWDFLLLIWGLSFPKSIYISVIFWLLQDRNMGSKQQPVLASSLIFKVSHIPFKICVCLIQCKLSKGRAHIQLHRAIYPPCYMSCVFGNFLWNELILWLPGGITNTNV